MTDALLAKMMTTRAVLDAVIGREIQRRLSEYKKKPKKGRRVGDHSPPYSQQMCEDLNLTAGAAHDLYEDSCAECAAHCASCPNCTH